MYPGCIGNPHEVHKTAEQPQVNDEPDAFNSIFLLHCVQEVLGGFIIYYILLLIALILSYNFWRKPFFKKYRQIYENFQTCIKNFLEGFNFYCCCEKMNLYNNIFSLFLLKLYNYLISVEIWLGEKNIIWWKFKEEFF